MENSDEEWKLEEHEEEESEGEGEATFDESCASCHGHGELVLCDYCAKGYHLKCAGLKCNPDGISKFSCSDCGDDVCDTCRGKLAFIRCHYCRRTYHAACIHRVPTVEDLWLCPACQREASQSIEKILVCRPYHRLSATEAARRVEAWAEVARRSGLIASSAAPGISTKKAATLTAKRRSEPEYLVRWTGKAYWHCSWVPESFLLEMAKIKLKNFKQRQTESKEICIDDGAPDTEEEAVINPLWLQVDRILDERHNRSIDGLTEVTECFIKWTALEYDGSTWELKSDLIRKGFDGAVQHFEKRDKEWVRALEGDLGLSLSVAGGKRQFMPLQQQPSLFVGGTWHEYQLEGINFLRSAWYAGNNVILADEMGLGKTIQAIGFLRCVAVENKEKFKPFMIVSPLAVVDNWEREFKLWCPEMEVVVYKGSQTSRELIQKYEARSAVTEASSSNRKKRRGNARSRRLEQSDDDEEDEEMEPSDSDDAKRKPEAGQKRRRCVNFTAARLDLKFHVLITSFEFAARDAGWLRRIKWGTVVVDEGHRLKGGSQGKLYKTLQDFDVSQRLILTGTPLQNSIEELFNLLHFIAPEKFAHIENFKDEFASMDKEEQLAKLRDQIAPHMLRRLKKDVNLCIPEKCELVVRVELSEVQKSYYRLILTQNFEVLRKKFKAASSIYNMIMQLKKVCNHPFLMQDEQDEQDVVAQEDHETRGKRLITSSGKLELLDRMLIKLKRDGHRVLLFSQMTSMLDILEEYLVYRGWKYQRLDGNTRAVDRQIRIDSFNRSQGKGDEEHFVFLLSTRAGGLGINLTSANTVIIYDLDWNPHNDLQALARAHRIGQTKKVMIYRFVTRNSVEERILQLAKKKLLLEHVVVGESSRGRNLSQDELDDVLKYGAEELFEEDTNEGAVTGTAESHGEAGLSESSRKWGDGNAGPGRRVIIWDEDAVEKLLDRSSEEVEAEHAETGVEMKQGGLGELFSSFKVARFANLEDKDEETVVEGEDEEVKDRIGVEAVETEEAQPLPGSGTGKSWVDLLEKRFEALIQEQTAHMGKGKRERKEVQRQQSAADELQMLEYDSFSEAEDSDPDYYDEARLSRSRQRRERPRSTVGMGVPGFGEQQRRAIKSFLMQFGVMDGDWQAFYNKLVGHSKGRLGDRTLQDVKRYVTSLLTGLAQRPASIEAAAAGAAVTGGEGGLAGNGTQGAAAASASDSSLLKRIAVIALIAEKVKEYEQQAAEEFYIDDGKQTGWSKAVSISSRSFKFTWGRAQDLLLLRLALKHGFGNWRVILQDPDFLTTFPAAAVGAPGVSAGAGAVNGEEVEGLVTAGVVDGGVEGGADDDGGAGGEGGAHGAALQPGSQLTRQLLQLITKRIKVMSDALAIERQKVQRRAEAMREVQRHVGSMAADALQSVGEALPPALPELLAQRDALKATLVEVFAKAMEETRVDQKREIVEFHGRGEDHQAALLNQLRRLNILMQSMNEARGQVILGPVAIDRLQNQVQQLDEMRTVMHKALEQAREHNESFEALLRKVYGPQGQPTIQEEATADASVLGQETPKEVEASSATPMDVVPVDGGVAEGE